MVKIFKGLVFAYLLQCSPFLFAQSVHQKEYKVATEADDIVTRALFDAISAEFDVSIQYVNFSSFDAILDSVAEGKSDFAANITFTEKRAKRFSYSRPTNIEYTYLFGHTDKTLDDIHNVGVPQDTIYSELIRHYYPDIEQVFYQGHDEAVELLNSGRVDGVVDAINQLKPMLVDGFDAQLLNDQISIKPVSIVSPKGLHLHELEAFSEYIHSEEVQKLLRERVAKYQFELRQSALREGLSTLPIDLKQPIIIKLEPIFPYVVYNDDGTIEGMTAEVVYKSCDILNLKCEIVSQKDESWESMYSQFIQGDIDMIAPLTISRDRRAFSYFTQPHYSPSSVMVRRLGYKPNVYSHVSQLISERIGVVKEDFFDHLLSQMLPLKSLKRYENQQALIDALLEREVDYIAMDTAMLNHFLRLSELLPIEQDNAIGEFYQSQLSVGLAKSTKGELLAPYFSRAISMLNLDNIVARYDLRPDWRTALEYEVRLATQTQAVFLFVLIFAICVSIYLYRQSNTDNLTGLRNRRSLQLRFRQGVSPELAILYLDINRFKQINDTYGHRAGDMVLQQLSNDIKALWDGRSYRLGGDEFILIGNPTQAQLELAIEKLATITLQDGTLDEAHPISVSVGCSVNRQKTLSLESALHLADEDMYQRKQASRQETRQKPADEIRV
ncbi:GGDEF domain-containing protein [Vibrio rotiferianus]|uniref:GGDEF domain-containing protein n=1 Tax=Vibrio rotiferianus TaxID=190895 RepID=UPI00148BFDFA|nr:GGDEF domain-containing protein [Vibrio rotiferianus]NOH67432.1 transporter substrate-binding domain-containing protein [Vibrio rotiferianus]